MYILHIQIYVYVHVHVCIYIHMYVHIYFYICTHVCRCTNMYIYIYTCIHVCIYIYIYLFIHTHIYACMYLYVESETEYWFQQACYGCFEVYKSFHSQYVGLDMWVCVNQESVSQVPPGAVPTITGPMT